MSCRLRQSTTGSICPTGPNTSRTSTSTTCRLAQLLPSIHPYSRRSRAASLTVFSSRYRRNDTGQDVRGELDVRPVPRAQWDHDQQEKTFPSCIRETSDAGNRPRPRPSPSSSPSPSHMLSSLIISVPCGIYSLDSVTTANLSWPCWCRHKDLAISHAVFHGDGAGSILSDA